ncbi:MAG: hypothetical protein AAGK93_01875 [Pseudomonadota bacterium]
MTEPNNDYPLWQKALRWLFTLSFISAVIFILFVVASSGKHTRGLYGEKEGETHMTRTTNPTPFQRLQALTCLTLGAHVTNACRTGDDNV